MIYILISLIIGITSIGIALYFRFKKDSKIIDNTINKLYKEKRQQLEEEQNSKIELLKIQYNSLLDKHNQDIEALKYKYDIKLLEFKENYNNTVTEYNKELTELQARQIKEKYDVEVLENKKQLLQNTLNDYYTEEKTRVEEKVKKTYDSAVEEMKNNLQLENERINLELKVQFDELEKYRLMRAAVNDAIMRERQLQEQSEFYKINLSEQDIADLLMLRELAPRFNNRELLNKVIYESYIKRPLQEMIKRVLKGRSPSGIYKITREKTGEIYIGRAVSVDKRWTEHAKMAFSIGSIAHSTLHTIMEKDGIWNFTFELLEEVPKENLNEREKYYIEFYDSKNFGLNQKTGNQ